MKELWVNKYAPKSIDEYVFKDETQRTIIEKWIKSGALCHILMSGSPGVGKTALFKMLMGELKVNDFDILEVNASKDNGVDFIRDKVTNFAETMGYGDIKYVFLDEADYLSPSAQAVLRNTMERYSNNVRFVLTCNYPHKIIPAIHSRCETGRMHIEKLDRDMFTLRLATILNDEGVVLDDDSMVALDAIIENTYPDMRRAISKLQANVNDGILTYDDGNNTDASDYKLEMIALFAAGEFRKARTLVCEQASPEEYQDIYTFMYQNLDVWANGDADKQDRAVLAIRDGLVKHTLCADIELNLAATFVELALIAGE